MKYMLKLQYKINVIKYLGWDHMIDLWGLEVEMCFKLQETHWISSLAK